MKKTTKQKKFELHAYAKQNDWKGVEYIPVKIIGRTKCPDHWCDGEDCEFSPIYLVIDAEGKVFDVKQCDLFIVDSLQGL